MRRIASQLKSWGLVFFPAKLSRVLKPHEQSAFRSLLEGATVDLLASYLERILTPAGASALQKLGLAQMRALVNGDVVPGLPMELLEANPGPHPFTPASAISLFRFLQQMSVPKPPQSGRLDPGGPTHRPLDTRGGFQVVDAPPAKQVGRWHGR